MTETVNKKQRPNTEARAGRISEKANFVSANEFGFTPLDFLDLIVKLLPLLSMCGFMAKNVRRPGPLMVNRINAACRKKFGDGDKAEVAAGTILADGETVTQADIDSMRAEL